MSIFVLFKAEFCPSNIITMLRKLILFIWSNISWVLFWLLGIARLRRKSECTTVSNPNNDNKSSNLTRLPDKLLLNIFDRVPVNDLICKIPRTCSQFARLNSEACNRRQSLKIVCTDTESFPRTQNNHICNTLIFGSVSQLNLQNCTKIISNFPNVHSLQLNASGVKVSQLNESIIDILLSRLYDQLEALHLELTFECHVRGWANIVRIFTKKHKPMQDAGIDGLERAFKLINRMANLKRLTVSTSSPLPLVELPIISQLKEFYIFSRENFLFGSLVKYGAGSRQLKRIGFGRQTLDDNIPITRCIRTPKTRELLAKMVNLSLVIDSQSPVGELQDLLLCMPNLCKLSILWVAHRPLVELIRALEPITDTNSKLITFKLCLVHDDHPVYDETQLDLSSLVDSSIQLRSIAHLQVRFCSRSHRTYQQLHLESIFPNLRTIHYKNIVADCSICGIDRFGYFTEHWWFRQKCAQCIKLMVQGVVEMRPKPEIIFKYNSWPSFKHVHLHL